jgi:predicted ester cyclase
MSRFRKLSPLPDLNWTIKELFVSGENTIIVRGEGTGTPIKTFLGAEPTGRSFRTMSIDLYTVTGLKDLVPTMSRTGRRPCVSLPTADYIDEEETPGSSERP